MKIYRGDVLLVLDAAAEAAIRLVALGLALAVCVVDVIRGYRD